MDVCLIGSPVFSHRVNGYKRKNTLLKYSGSDASSKSPPYPKSPPSPPAPTAPNEYSNPRHACNETDPRHDYHRPLSAVSHGHTRFTVACEEVTFFCPLIVTSVSLSLKVDSAVMTSLLEPRRARTKRLHLRLLI